jgi:O-antigen/teichoic acid export membrane protein
LRIQEVKQYWKYALFFNLPLIPHYLSQVLLNQADRIMISKLINNSAVALYSLAYTIGMLASIITQSINNAYIPWMYRALKDSNIKEINKNNQILLGVVACVIMCVFFCAPELILVLGGDKYVESTVVVYPVACSVYFVFVYTLFANIELYYEKRKYVAIGTMYSAVLNIILNWFLIKQFGYVTAAYTTLFCYICYGVFHMFIANKILKMKKITVSLDFYPALIIGGLLVGMSLISQIFINYLAIRIGLFIIIIVVIFTFRKKILMFLQRKMK